MELREGYLAILRELSGTAERLEDAAGEALCKAILGAPRIFLAGAGRSGLAARAFAMRLMHLGLDARVCGEATAPGIRAGDLLLVVSGSGETASLRSAAKKAKELGASLALVTTRPASTIGALADVVAAISAPTPKAESKSASIQPMGSLFEQAAALLLDAVVLELMDRLGETDASMFSRHANLE